MNCINLTFWKPLDNFLIIELQRLQSCLTLPFYLYLTRLIFSHLKHFVINHFVLLNQLWHRCAAPALTLFIEKTLYFCPDVFFSVGHLRWTDSQRSSGTSAALHLWNHVFKQQRLKLFHESFFSLSLFMKCTLISLHQTWCWELCRSASLWTAAHMILQTNRLPSSHQGFPRWRYISCQWVTWLLLAASLMAAGTVWQPRGTDAGRRTDAVWDRDAGIIHKRRFEDAQWDRGLFYIDRVVKNSWGRAPL